MSIIPVRELAEKVQGRSDAVLEMEKPHVECVEMHPDGTYGRFVIEPLERGYGITLANSLRRILLSSLPGAAITTVKIDGVLHEFSTLPGVNEDVVEIILNLKSIPFRLHTDESRVVRLSASGEGRVTAGDIVTDPDVEIVNSDLPVATLDAGARFNVEMTVERGRGYVPAEKNKDPNQPIGVIPVDSLFSPVQRVNYRIENTRIGQVTNFDKLTLDLWTNGAIRPDEAISLAAKVMVQHLNLFINITDDVPEVEMTQRDGDEQDKLFEMGIDELELSVRSYNCLKRAGIDTIGELIGKTPDEMMKVRNLGRKSLDEVEEKLGRLGLSLRTPED